MLKNRCFIKLNAFHHLSILACTGLVLLTSCLSKEENEAVTEIARFMNAKGYGTNKSYNASTSDGRTNKMTITLSGVPDAKDAFTERCNVSIAAKKYLDLASSDLKNYGTLYFVIEHGQKANTYEYNVHDLFRVNKFLSDLKPLFSDSCLHNPSAYESLFDNRWISDSAALKMRDIVLRIDSVLEHKTGITLEGFQFSHMNDTHEAAFVAWFDTGDQKKSFRFQVALVLPSMKISNFVISDAHEPVNL